MTVRPFRPEDEAGVLELLRVALGPGPIGERSSDFFAWKHRRNPFGPSFMLVAEEGGRIVGLRALMRWRFRSGERTLTAVRAVDTATHPDHRRRGVFSRLTSEALEALQGDAAFVFNTPNQLSLPAYLKLGWHVVGTVPVQVRIASPWRLGRRPAVEAEPVAAALEDAGLSQLLHDTATDGRLSTPRDLDYLRWRYASPPRLDYRAIREKSGGRLRGLAVFRVRRRARLWESTIAELIVKPGDRATADGLVRRVASAARVDHLACCLPSRRGFARAPRGPTLVVRPLGRVEPDPAQAGSWALSLGDLEVL